MSRWLPTAAVLAALALSTLTGCGTGDRTGTSSRGGAPTGAVGQNTGKAPETGKDTGKGAGHHDPG